ncbi:hypothetical protein ACFXKR_41145 [Streptomyces violascens]|uniref:hypothetical protein n=1 Tax=Streptomyces violascens TaxID=67381 RepID=UPI003691BF1E
MSSCGPCGAGCTKRSSTTADWLAKAAGLGDRDVLTARTLAAVETLLADAAGSAGLWATHDIHGPVDQAADLLAQAHEAAQSDLDPVPSSNAAHALFAVAVLLLRQARHAHRELGQSPAGYRRPTCQRPTAQRRIPGVVAIQ